MVEGAGNVKIIAEIEQEEVVFHLYPKLINNLTNQAAICNLKGRR